MGMLPGGIEDNEIAFLWGSNWQEPVESLLNYSLLYKRQNVDKESVIYCLPPFMNNYADAKIPEDDKLLFHEKICIYYSNICKQILDVNGKAYKSKNRQSDLNHKFIEKLLKHETNIWACIYRMVEGHGPMMQEDLNIELDVDEVKKDIDKALKRFSTLNPRFKQIE